MAQAIGIDVTRLFSIAFALGSGLAAFGGAIGFAILPLEPLYPFKYLALVLVIVALSGFGNVKASAAVAVLVGRRRYRRPPIVPGVRRLHHLHRSGRAHAVARSRAVRPARGMSKDARSELLSRDALRPAEVAPWLIAAAAFFIFPSYLPLGTTALIMALFALSLDIAMGFAGIVTLGHALFFGLGAYAAGLLALAGLARGDQRRDRGRPCRGAAGAMLGPLILRMTGLPLLMVTLALGVMAYEAANKATWLTGGDNGFDGITITPLFGVFPWSVYGRTGYLYALGWLFVLFWVTRRIIASPFGVALQGVRENRQRMALVGAPVLWHLVRAYVVSAFMAGVAGALSAQTTGFVGLQVLSLDNSTDVIVMLVLGGIGRLYGGLLGAPVYVLVKDFAAEWNPYHWMFVIGGLLIFVVRFARGGLLGMADVAIRWPAARRGQAAK